MATRTRSLCRIAGAALLASVAGAPLPAEAATSEATPVLALAEVSVPAARPGLDAATLKRAAEQELEATRAAVPGRRRVLVSLAVTGASDAPVAVSVNALLRDRESGSMLAVTTGTARSEGRSDVERRRAVLQAAVRNAVRQIPDALGGS